MHLKAARALLVHVHVHVREPAAGALPEVIVVAVVRAAPAVVVVEEHYHDVAVVGELHIAAVGAERERQEPISSY